MAHKVLRLYDVLGNQQDSDSITQKRVLNKDSFTTTNLAATSYWTSSHAINYEYVGGNQNSQILRPITYGYNATGYTDWDSFNYSSSNWKRHTSGAGGQTAIGTPSPILYFPDNNRCLTTGEQIVLDYYEPYPSNYSSGVGFGWRYSSSAASSNSLNPGSNWHVIAYFLMDHTPTLSGSSISNVLKPYITSSNYTTIQSLYVHPTCVGYFNQTHYGKPPSRKSVYNTIYHNPYYKYDVTSNSDYGFYMVPSSVQTGGANILFVVFTDIPYRSSRTVKLQWRFYGYDSIWSSYYNHLNYEDVVLTYLGTNIYNTMYTAPSGYQALSYVYCGWLFAVPNFYWVDIVGRSWMELCGLWY